MRYVSSVVIGGVVATVLSTAIFSSLLVAFEAVAAAALVVAPYFALAAEMKNDAITRFFQRIGTAKALIIRR